MSSYTLDPTILREYDIRGVIDETLTVEGAQAIGRAFGTMVVEKGGKTVCVGYDGRLSSPDLEAAVVDGLMACGLTAVRIGLGPTPMLYFAVNIVPADAGIMISGSHNPPEYNGFKMMLGKAPFYGGDIQRLGEIAANGAYAEGEGQSIDQPVHDKYVKRLAEDYSGGRPLKVAWDAGNGSAGDAMRDVCALLPGEHILINENIDGTFPAHHPDPTVPECLEQLQDVVRTQGCDFGMAFDGDGDRIGAVDGQGRILWGDQLMVLLASDVLDALPGATIIADVKASQTLFDEVDRMGGNPLMWRTGHSLIKAKMAETQAPLAGEMSGHIFFADKYYGYDDGLYAAVRLLNHVSHQANSLAEIRDSLPQPVNTPELRFPCDDTRKFEVVDEVLERMRSNGANLSDVDGLRVKTDDGWWLLRASNTQDVLVARCEANDDEGLERLRNALVTELVECGVEPPQF
ncbi:MAG: phosphomannomutase [Rhodospirillaceae bacterium]|nr:phosphomannomutase [Rhodospirillaceae bacterium]|tara:strand:+ start:4408 stop:5787 length:1380 start_codon:yes stop_codon:yes gene_type:complete